MRLKGDGIDREFYLGYSRGFATVASLDLAAETCDGAAEEWANTPRGDHFVELAALYRDVAKGRREAFLTEARGQR